MLCFGSTCCLKNYSLLSPLQELRGGEAVQSEDEKVQALIMEDLVDKPLQPLISRDNFRKLLLAILALASSAVITCSSIIISYLLITHTFSPRRLHYTMPLPLDLRGSDLVSNISMYSLHQYHVDGQTYRILLDHKDQSMLKPLVSPGQIIHVWLEIMVPPEYENRHPERRFAHVTSTLSTHGGEEVGKMSRPVYLNGRAGSAMDFFLMPWRWFGIIKRYHMVKVVLFSGFREMKSNPSIFLTTEIQARSPPGPEILEASVHISLQANVIQKILFYARPQSLLGKLLGVGSIIAIIVCICILWGCFQMYRTNAAVRMDEYADDDIVSEDTDTVSDCSSPRSVEGASDRVRSPGIVSEGISWPSEPSTGSDVRKRK
jgi:hypothetical protein